MLKGYRSSKGHCLATQSVPVLQTAGYRFTCNMSQISEMKLGGWGVGWVVGGWELHIQYVYVYKMPHHDVKQSHHDVNQSHHDVSQSHHNVGQSHHDVGQSQHDP